MKALAPVVYALCALAWTWPAAGSAALFGRRPDAAGTVWFIDAADRLARSLSDPMTGWPAGAHYARPDSWVLLGVGLLTDGLDPVRVHAGVAIGGLVLSAWAAESFAREVGARAPWSLIAGFAYAFGGLAATAWVEGYVYHLADPWLPLLGRFLWRAGRAGGRPADELLAALAFALTLLTTAWHGLGACLLAGGLGLAGLRGGRSASLFWGLALPILLGYAWLLGGSGSGEAVAAGVESLPARLLAHSAPTWSIDIDGRSQTAFVAPTMIALFFASPRLLQGQSGWRGIALTGLVALAAAVLPWSPAYWLPYAPEFLLKPLNAFTAAVMRFPERIGWTWLLCGGVVAARAATALAGQAGPRTGVLLLSALVEVFAGVRLPWRQGEAPGGVPSAYLQAEGPVLDLWPEDVSPEPGWDLRVTNLGCFYQAGHGRPIADHCILTPGVESPRARLGRWAHDRLRAGDGAGVRAALAELGFSTLAVHPDLYPPGERARLAAALAAVDPAPVRSTDQGEHVVAYALGPAGPAPAEAWARWGGG